MPLKGPAQGTFCFSARERGPVNQRSEGFECNCIRLEPTDQKPRSAIACFLVDCSLAIDYVLQAVGGYVVACTRAQTTIRVNEVRSDSF